MDLKKNYKRLEELLPQYLSEPGSMLSIPDWLCSLIEAGISNKVDAGNTKMNILNLVSVTGTAMG